MTLLLVVVLAAIPFLALRRDPDLPREQVRGRRSGGARRQLRPGAVVLLGLLAAAAQAVLLLAAVAAVIWAHLLVIAGVFVGFEPELPQVDWRLATALWRSPEVLGVLALLAVAAAVTVLLGRRPTVRR